MGRKFDLDKKHIAKNAGYSLVEVIVVIAIMAILTGAGISMMGLLPNARVRSCSKKIVSHLEKTRTSAMSFEDAVFYLYRKSDGIYVTLETTRGGVTSSVEEKVGDPSVTVSYTLAGEAAVDFADDGEKLMLSFDRSSGAFRKPKIMDTDATVTEQSAYCTMITVSAGSRIQEIRLVPLTGKIDD